nr:hypothetical protein [Tanacetum cinerariifolium]
MANSNNPYAFPAPHQDQPSFNQNYMQQPMLNPKDITDPTTAMNMELALMAKAFKLNYSTPTNNNQRISSNLRNRQIAQPARAEGNGAGHNGNQIRCYNYRGVGHFARNYTVRLRRRDAAYVQTQLLIAQKEEAGIQLQAEEFDLMAAAVDLDEIEELVSKTDLICLTKRTMFHGRLVFSGDPNREVPVNETFHVQTDDELTEKELKHIEADDQAIQTILLGLPKDIYAAVDSCETAQEIWFISNDGESIESYYHCFLKLMNDLKRNKHFPEKIASNHKSLNNLQPEWSRHVTIVHQTKDLHTADYTQLYDFLKYNQKENVGNLNGYNDVQNVKNQVIYNAVQNLRVQNVRNQNGLIGVPGNANHNPNGNGNLLAVRTEGNATGHNGNQIRCYNCRGVDHFARNCTVKPRRRDVAYLQTQLLIAQKEEAGIQLQAEEFDLMAAAADLDEIEEVNANCILMANLQQASTSGTQTNKAPVYDSDGSAEEISDLNKQPSKEKSTVSFLLEEKKKLKSDFKIREDELLDRKIQLEKRIKELDNILVKTGQSIQTIHMLSPKPDSFYHTEQKMALGYQNHFYLKQAQKKQQSLYDGKVLFEKHDPAIVHDSE